MQRRSLDCCREGAVWKATVWNSTEWLANHPTCHPFFRMEGSGLDLIFPDLMHLKHLGTDQLLLGSVLVWLTKHFLGGTMRQNLNVVWDFIRRWYKDCGTSLKSTSTDSKRERLSCKSLSKLIEVRKPTCKSLRLSPPPCPAALLRRTQPRRRPSAWAT